MALPHFSMRWNDHTSALATGCKSLLNNNSLVDCTITAEGQKLRAHRLILSACSPYFHMLFSEESEKDPIVILTDVSFETLKTLVDFIYHGEAEIPQERYEAFLALGQSLQIMGLNYSAIKDKNKNIRCNADQNATQQPSNGDWNTREVQSPSTTPGDGPENFLEQHSHQHQICDTDDMGTNSSVSRQGCSHLEVKSESAMTSLHEQQSRPVCDELPLHTEITAQSEPLLPDLLEPKSEPLEENEYDETESGNFTEERGDTGSFPELCYRVLLHNLNERLNSSGTSHENTQLASSLPQQLQQEQQEQPMEVVCKVEENEIDVDTESTFVEQHPIQHPTTSNNMQQHPTQSSKVHGMVTAPLEWQDNVVPQIRMAGYRSHVSNANSDGNGEINEYSTSAGACYVPGSSACYSLTTEKEVNERIGFWRETLYNTRPDEFFHRKRKIHCDTWKIDQRKIFQDQARAYESSLKKKIEGAERGPPCGCSRECFSLISEEEKSEIFEKFWNMKHYNQQNSYLSGLIKVVSVKRKYTKMLESRRKHTFEYYVKIGSNQKVCKKAFLALYGLHKHRGRVEYLQKHIISETTSPPPDKRDRHENESNKIPDQLRMLREHYKALQVMNLTIQDNNAKRKENILDAI